MGELDELLEFTGMDRWNAIYTVCLGELVENGVFDWTIDALDWSAAAFDDDQYKRVCDYFIERYRYREISIEPFLEWATMLKRKLVFELMPKYTPLYKRFAEGIDPFQATDEYHKRRTIGSDYPETLLSGNADYISDGEDEEHETLREGDILDQIAKYTETFRGVDEMLVEELESMFISLYTVNANAF